MKKLPIILIILLLIGCKTKHTTTTSISKDSIYKKEILKIALPQLNEIVIDNPCDSLGNLKPFNYTFTSDKVKTTLKAINDTIYLEQNIDSLIDVRIEEYKSSHKSKDVVQVITKTRWPKFLWYSLLFNILALAYVFRKFIPFLKFIP